MSTAQTSKTPATATAATEISPVMVAFETWVERSRPKTSLERKDEYGFHIYASNTLQAEWIAFAAGWAFRGMLPPHG